jgi:hypothetical protein
VRPSCASRLSATAGKGPRASRLSVAGADLEGSEGLRHAPEHGNLAIQRGETQHLERLVLGDDREAAAGVKVDAEIDQKREHRGVDESAAGEVDQEWRGVLLQSALNLRLEHSRRGQIQLPAHLNRSDTADCPVLDFREPRLRGETVVDRVDIPDTSSF